MWLQDMHAEARHAVVETPMGCKARLMEKQHLAQAIAAVAQQQVVEAVGAHRRARL